MKGFKLLALLLMTVFLVIFLAAVSTASSTDDTEFITMGRKIRHQLLEQGSSLTGLHMNGWAKINDRYMTRTELETLAEETMSTLEWDWLSDVKFDEKGHTRQIKCCGEQDGGHFAIIFQNGPKADGSLRDYDTYITVDIAAGNITETDEELIYRKMHKLISLFKDKPCIRRTYTATVPGRLNTDNMESICKKLIWGLGGNITEESRDGGWISLTGYSKEIGFALSSGSKQINLNAASRYNEFEDKTYIWLGTPIITLSY